MCVYNKRAPYRIRVEYKKQTDKKKETTRKKAIKRIEGEGRGITQKFPTLHMNRAKG